jgi:predicted MFS family arabinose efflux permease
MRPAIFIFLFGMDSSLSFLPLHMENLYEPLFGLSKDFMVGLPITVEFLFVGVAILISGAWFDRRGWRRPFLGGLVLAATGSVYSAVAPDAIQFVLSRAVVGSGFGLALMASQGFVITHTHDRNKTQGLAHMFAGLYAGSICGGAAGAMLAEYYGYSFVFLLGAGVIVLGIGYTMYFLPTEVNDEQQSEVKISQKFRASDLRNFLLNRNVLSLVFFSSLPAAIAVVGFLNYFSPIYLNRMGASESTIGQILIIYGTCLILAGPTIGKFVDASNDKKYWIFVGCLLGSAAFLVFSFLDGVPATMLAILLLGLSSSFVLSSQTAFALQLSVTKELGQGKAVAIFRSTSRAGQALGPIVFATLIGAMGMRDGIVALGIFYLVAATMFLLVTQKDKHVLPQTDAA